MTKKLISAFCVVVFACTVSVASADLAELKSRVEALESKAGGTLGGVELYGSFRPSVRYSDYDGDNRLGDERDDETDLKDNLSRLGVTGHVDLDHGWSAFYRGEWSVNFGDDDDEGADLGDARLAYVGLGTPFGAIAIGQQWNTYYNIVAEVTDIYEHASSPFGWDSNGPFRTPSMVTYKHHIGNLNIQAGGRFNGGEDGTSHRHANEYNIGAGYRLDIMNAYLGVAFRNTQADEIDGVTFDNENTGIDSSRDNADTDWWAVGGSINPTDRLYLAFTYQDGEQDDGEGSIVLQDDGSERAVYDDADKDSLDIVASYDFGNGWNGIVGYFDSEDDSDARREYDGYNLTVVKRLNSNMRIWAEWLSTDPDGDGDDDALFEDGVYNPYYAEDTFSVGFRYDFSTK